MHKKGLNYTTLSVKRLQLLGDFASSQTPILTMFYISAKLFDFDFFMN